MGVGKMMYFLLIFLASMALSDNTTETTTMVTTTSGVTPVSVIFKSLQSTFTVELLNPSSTAFMNRSSMIKAELEPKFNSAFASFKTLMVELFRNGSVVNEMKLWFDSTNVPNVTQIANVMINASTSVTGFDIDRSSITVNGVVSSGITHSGSLLTASCLALLSYLLSSQQQRWS